MVWNHLNVCVWNLRQTEVRIKHTVLVKKYNSYKPTKPACQELMQETADHFLVWETWGLCESVILGKEMAFVLMCVTLAKGQQPQELSGSWQQVVSSGHSDTWSGQTTAFTVSSSWSDHITANAYKCKDVTWSNKRFKNTQIWTVQVINNLLKHTENHFSHSVIYMYKILFFLARQENKQTAGEIKSVETSWRCTKRSGSLCGGGRSICACSAIMKPTLLCLSILGTFQKHSPHLFKHLIYPWVLLFYVICFWGGRNVQSR